MARDGSGTYNLPAGNPVVTGTTISSTWANNTLSDIATALSASIAKDGQTTPTANIPMGNKRLTGLGAATALTDAPQASQVQNASFVTLGTVAGTNTITATVTPVPAAYAAGQTFSFIPAATNSGATTLNISSIGPADVYKNGAACAGGELKIGVPCVVSHDGTRFNIIGPEEGPITSSGITMSTNRLLGRTTAATGAPEEITVGAGLSLSAGTLSGGGMTLLSTTTANASATVDIETTFSSTYDVYCLTVTGLRVETNNQTLSLRMKIGGSYVTTNYYSVVAYQDGAANDVYVGYGENGSLQATIGVSLGNAAAKSADYVIWIHNPAGTTFAKGLHFSGRFVNNAGTPKNAQGFVYNSGTNALTGVRFYAVSGNIAVGTFRLYGVAQ